MIAPPRRNGIHGDIPMRDFISSAESNGNGTAAIAATSAEDQFSAPDLRRYLAEIKGQAQFLLYLTDQIEESLDQLNNEADACHGAFLCKVLDMYSNQLESRHHGLGEKIAEACQEVYVTVREHEHGLG
jgi:hypothetical protein